MRFRIPTDFLVAVSRSNRRTIEIPTVLVDELGNGNKAVRLEFALLLNVVIICDYRVVHIFSTS
jgi:hypothetical protein